MPTGWRGCCAISDWADEVEENGYVASGSAKARKPRDEESWDEDDEGSEEADEDGDF